MTVSSFLKFAVSNTWLSFVLLEKFHVCIFPSWTQWTVAAAPASQPSRQSPLHTTRITLLVRTH